MESSSQRAVHLERQQQWDGGHADVLATPAAQVRRALTDLRTVA